MVSLLLVACQQEEVALTPAKPGKGIIFTSDYVVSKASQTRTSFREGDMVGVLGYCWDTDNGNLATEWDTKKTGCLPEVFHNQQLTFGSGGVWSYTWDDSNNPMGLTAVGDLQPWVDDDASKYTFFAYYPYAQVSGYSSGRHSGTIRIDGKGMGEISLPGTDGNANHGDPEISYTMPHTGYNTSAPLDWKAVPDLMVASKINHTPGEGTVNLNFEHLLCAMEFRVNNYTSEDIVLTGLSLRGENFYRDISKKGTDDYTVGTSTYDGTFDLLAGNPLTCPAARETEGQTPPIQTPVADADGTIHLLFIADRDGKITYNGSCSIVITQQGQSARTMTIAANTHFQAGVRNIFSINYIGNDVVLQVSHSDLWEEGGDSNIVFE